MTAPRPGSDVFWTANQRRGITALLAILLVVFAGIYLVHHTFIDNPQPEVPARVAELANRLDPNTAGWEEIAAIPEVGEKKARALVKYRDDQMEKHPGSRVFNGPQDLRAVKGIGPATVSNMTPYLIFPEEHRIQTKK